MEPIVAYRLNEVFKDWAANKSMQRMETSISVKTLSGASLEIKPTSPAEAAEYLHELLTTKNRLFRPGVHRAPSSQTTHAERQESIVFRSAGRICDASGKVDYGRVLVHISFTSQDDFSASSFAEHFRDDISTPEASLNGPKIRHFINTLRSAGNDWKKVHFTTHINPIPLQRIK